MGTIDDYIIYCTPEQTKKALKLGVPIEEAKSLIEAQTKKHLMLSNDRGGFILPYIPTAEQMIGFILEKTPTLVTQLCGLISKLGYKLGCLTFIDLYL